MKISTIQFETKFKDKEKNLNLIEDYCLKIDTDLLIFPELATTGYFFTDKSELKKFANKFDDNTIQHFQKLSTELNKIIIFGFPEIFEDKIFNSAAILIPNPNKSTVYRKTHLFYKEKNIFDEGDTGFFVVEYENLRLGTMICYDWRFPEAARTLALKGANLIACPSNLVTGVWQGVMSARALENKVYIAVANKYGQEENSGEVLTFNGESAIYSYNGQYLAKASVNKEEVLTTTIEPEKTVSKSFNEYNDIFKDRRPNFYQ